MEYFSYDYVYYTEGSVDEEEEKEEKVMEKVEWEEDRVMIVEEEGSQKAGASGTILGPGGFFCLLVLLRFMQWAVAELQYFPKCKTLLTKVKSLISLWLTHQEFSFRFRNFLGSSDTCKIHSREPNVIFRWYWNTFLSWMKNGLLWESKGINFLSWILRVECYTSISVHRANWNIFAN